MFSLRLAMILSLLYAFTVIAFEGPIIDPNGGRSRVTVSSDQGGATDPDGRNTAVGITPDAGPRIDPEG